MCAVTIFLAILALIECVKCGETAIHQRFEYQFGFKGPLLSQKDGLIPFWEHGGHAIASEDKVRLAPSMRNKQGFMWSKKRTSFEGFEVDFAFRINGRGKVGADGLAMWFVAEKSRKGPVYGVGDKWNGLGLFFDTYDNDGQLNNPIVTAVVNDGTKSYDHDVDGEGQSVGHCIRDFRNRPFPVLVRVRYFEGELSVSINNGNTEAKIDLQPCFSVKNVKLPSAGYFGLSAATGGIADDHDVISFEVHSLSRKSSGAAKEGVSDADRQKFDKEFADHMEKMKKAQNEYETEHKDDKKKKKKKGYKSEGDEGEEVRRLRQIWEEQSAIHSVVNGVSAKLDLLMSQLERLSKGGFSAGGKGDSIPGDVVRKEDLVEAREKMTSAITDVRNAMERIRGGGGASSEGHHEGGGGGANFYELRQLSHELRDSIQTVRDDLRKLDGKVPALGSASSSSGTGCPTCLTTSVFVVVTFLNGFLVIGAIFFKLSQENSAKKFY